MTLAGDSILVTPGTGATVATHTVASKEHQVIMQADADGHILGSAPTYYLFQQPRVLTSSATDQWDLFNATGSGKVVRIRGLWPSINITAATAFTASFVFELRRTSAIGTGGTAHTFEATTTPGSGAVNIARISTVDPSLSASITSRGVPTGGATSAAFLFNVTLFTEETDPASHQLQLVNWLPELPGHPPLELQENQGIKLRQTSLVASTGVSIGWLVAFAVVP